MKEFKMALSRGLLVTVAMMSMIFMASTGAAVAKTGQDQGKYAVVDMQEVILNVEEGKSARAELEKEIRGKEAELLKKREELDKMNNDWREQAPLLSEQARMKKQQEFQEKFMSLRNEEMTFQNEIKRKEQVATQKIAVAVSQLVNDLAEKRGFDMVFETSSAGLLYLKNPVDLTDDVIKAFEANSKKSGSTAKK
ncbi:MAG: OmpH family outer membrane protein [Oligoflexus sp.]